MHIRNWARAAVAAGVWVAAIAPAARASFHEWKISEAYSNASGTVQFIEFLQSPSPSDDERFIGGQSLTESALGHSFIFPSGLESEPSGGSRFLVGTPGYAALTGVPPPDYVLPQNNFFRISGDTINFAFVDQITFTDAQLPKNGVDSLNRAYGAATFTTARNSPTNFAGQSGSIVPEPAAAGLIGFAALWVLRRRAKRD